jgi:ribose transport system substrate-binding protein
MSNVATELTSRFTALGDKFEVASADMSPGKQIEQIENFISLGVDAIIIMAVDASSLSDVVMKAQTAGIKIIAFSQPLSVYDLYLGADDYALGKKEAEMAADWMEATFPDAADGSIPVAIFENRDKPMAATRSDGFKEIANLTKKATVVATVGVDTTNAGGQSAAENLMITHPEVKVILSYNGDTAMGVDAYAMSLNSAIKDKATFATFGIDFNGAAIDAIQKSSGNESIWRGTIMMGKSIEAMYVDIVTFTKKCLHGELETKDQFTDIYKVTPDNLAKVFDGTIE